MDIIKFIKDNESTKLRDISFEKESINDPTNVTTGATSGGIVVILYTIGVAYQMGVVNQDILVLPLI